MFGIFNQVEKWIPNVLGGMQLFVAVSALPAGFMMILDPTGTTLGLSAELLSDAPFSNFLIPGIFLFTVNGVAHLMGAIYSLRKHQLHAKLGLLLGALLIGWLTVQVLLIGLISSLQIAFFAIGLVEVVLALYAHRLQYFRANK